MRRRLLPLLVSVATLAASAGCGFGAGEEQQGDGVSLRVTRDFGREALSSARAEKVREGQTAMRWLQSENDVKTRFGGGFVQEIDGLAGGGAANTRDWFFYVNGIESSTGAADYDLSPGDVVQWDFRDWRETMDIRAIVGAFPEPFLHGLEGKRFPVRVECEDESSDACEQVKDRLVDAGVPATGATLGAPGFQNVIRVVVARWARARELPSAAVVESGPRRSGVFARYDDDGEKLELLDLAGEVVQTAGPSAGLVAAVRPTDDELVWLVTGGDERGVTAAAHAFNEASLRDAFAVAVEGDDVLKLPLEAR
jgi:hypothetical protein